MSDYIKYMYREYLEGRTRIKKVNEDQPLFPNTGAGLLIQKNKLTDDWTALNVSDGHYEEESFKSPSPRTAASTIPSTVSISTPKSMGWVMSHISRYMMCRSQTSRNVWPGAQSTSMRFPDRSMS